jgi:hypothetical protein
MRCRLSLALSYSNSNRNVCMYQESLAEFPQEDCRVQTCRFFVLFFALHSGVLFTGYFENKRGNAKSDASSVRTSVGRKAVIETLLPA